VAHRRPAHEPRWPVHVTLRARGGLASLRGGSLFRAVRAALAAASSRAFRVLAFSVQADHIHLLVEADGGQGLLARGLQGLTIRVAKAINRALGWVGRVWADRYHARRLCTPREVRNAMVYVLHNWKKHLPTARGLDPCSSARWFSGWAAAPRGETAIRPGPVMAPRTWLAAVGWRRYGLIGRDEAPKMPWTHERGDSRLMRRASLARVRALRRRELRSASTACNPI
jgi:REP element-mobilizing transposase RayT